MNTVPSNRSARFMPNPALPQLGIHLPQLGPNGAVGAEDLANTLRADFPVGVVILPQLPEGFTKPGFGPLVELAPPLGDSQGLAIG